MIKAITFDLWDTVIHDDSDEQKRKARGFRSKREERRWLVWRALERVEPIPRETSATAWDVTEAAFKRVWHDLHVTWTVAERLDVLLQGLKRQLPEDVSTSLIKALEEMELEVAPDPIEGVDAALESLHARYDLGVVSDAIVSPGRCLRRWLEMHDLARFFSAYAFSDEVGHSKPHRDMFASAAGQLGAELHEMVHIGDRDHNDIKGAQALGMKAVLFVATRDVDREKTSADAVCESYKELPAVIERLGEDK